MRPAITPPLSRKADMRSRTGSFILAAAAAALTACSSSPTLGTLIIDVFVATGDNRTEHGGAEPLQAAINDINRAGGVRGQQIEIFLHDTLGRNETATREAVDLRKQNIAAIFAVPSDVTISVVQAVTLPSNVFVMATGAAADEITTEWERRAAGYLARTTFRGSTGARRLARLAYDDGVRRIGVIHGGDPFGVEFAEEFTAAFRTLGGDITGDPPAAMEVPTGALRQSYQTELAFASEGATLVGGKAAVMVATSPGAFKVLLADAATQGLGIRWYGAHTVRALGVLDDHPEAAVGMKGITPARGKAADYAAYEASFREAWPQLDPGSVWYAHAYDAMVVFALAAARTPGELTSDKIRTNLRKVANAGLERQVVGPTNLVEAFDLAQREIDVDYQGASGVLDFNVSGDALSAWMEYETQGTDFVDLAQ